MTVLEKERRCPWCGEKVQPPSERYATVKKCEFCGNRYSLWWTSKSVLLEITAYFLGAIGISAAVEYLNVFCAVAGIALFLLIDNLKFNAYKRVDETSRKCKSYLVEATVTVPKQLKNTMIYPICFADSDKQICVQLTNIKHNGSAAKLEICALPLEEELDESHLNRQFRMFLDQTEIANGTIVKELI